MTIIATAAIAHRSHASVLAVSAMGGGLEIRPTFLRIVEGLIHGKPRRYPQEPAFFAIARVQNADALDLAKLRDATAYNCFKHLRWHETGGEPYCPKCGTLRCHTMSQGRFKCSEKTRKSVFSVTSINS